MRALVIACFLIMAGCSSTVKKPDDYPVDQSALPALEEQEQTDSSQPTPPTQLSSLAEGNHHPALTALFRQAEAARQQQQWRKALTYLDQARQIQPRNAAVLYRQAWVMLQLGQAAKAEQLLRRAKVFAGPNPVLNRRLNWLLADSLDAQGRTAEAQTFRQ